MNDKTLNALIERAKELGPLLGMDGLEAFIDALKAGKEVLVRRVGNKIQVFVR